MVARAGKSIEHLLVRGRNSLLGDESIERERRQDNSTCNAVQEQQVLEWLDHCVTLKPHYRTDVVILHASYLEFVVKSHGEDAVKSAIPKRKFSSVLEAVLWYHKNYRVYRKKSSHAQLEGIDLLPPTRITST